MATTSQASDQAIPSSSAENSNRLSKAGGLL